MVGLRFFILCIIATACGTPAIAQTSTAYTACSAKAITQTALTDRLPRQGLAFDNRQKYAIRKLA
jgi:hypothetical protein